MNKIEFKEHVLANGLKIVVHEDRSLPQVVINLLYQVGAKDENPERTGFAHLFEHLMFGGSKNVPDFDKALQQVGGTNNAFTNNDITNYYTIIPSNQIETAFWIESDRLYELDFSEEKLEKEKSVVIEEYKQRYLNKPYGDAHLILRDIHYTQHPYRWPTIGKDPQHILDATLDEVKSFFYNHYCPDNAILVLAGDISFEKAVFLAEKWFGPIKRSKKEAVIIPAEPKQLVAREKTVNKEVPNSAVYKMFHIPSKKDKEYFTVDLITDLLSGGKASMLFQELVKNKKVANSISAFSWGAYEPGILSIDGVLTNGTKVKTYEEDLKEVFESIQSVDKQMLNRIKTAIETQLTMEKTTLLNVAIGLAMSVALGNINMINDALDSYLEIELDDVKRAAEQYLNPNNSSTLYYLSEK